MDTRDHKHNRGEDLKLGMTPMIDVVFQLLIFFIVTLRQQDLLSYLNISKPGTQDPTPKVEVFPPILSIHVYDGGYVLQGRRVALAELDRQLGRLSAISKDTSIVIKCTEDSAHSRLVQLLDVCAKSKLRNISVFTM